MRKKFFVYAFILTILISLPSPVLGELKFKWGPYLRLRHEYWRNIYDFDNTKLDNRNFFRIKTSLWGQADFDEETTFFIKLTNENKAYAYWGDNTTGNKDYHYDTNEVIFDNIYLDVKNIFDLPWDIRFGRQDLSLSEYGEGFLIADGGPRDGSRAFYFNALKATWHVMDKNVIEFIGLKAPKTDDILPILHEVYGEQSLAYSDEIAFMVYHKGDSIKNFHLENYYIYKQESSGRPTPLVSKSIINTLGSFCRYDFVPWTLRGQFAYQFGTYGPNDRCGFGGYAYLDRDFKGYLWNPKLSIGYYYLSGDKKSTSNFEGFNQLFSTYSWMSEIYNLSFSKETGTGYWTNLQMPRASLTLNFTPKAKGALVYNFLKANESCTGIDSSFGTGRERGHLPQVRFDYAFTKNISAYFLAEYFIPGNFYIDKSDEALFLRTELQIKF